MGLIRVLPPTLVNRIAAGECVERPASVVKELMENALDAGAARVEVEVLDGGRALIQVSDDGVGMDADDLRLAVLPHATSKLSCDDDLFNIHTLGFRGEALASIGAVSRMQLTSRRHDHEVGHTLRVEAGAVGTPQPCAAPPGTIVAVHDLFYCVPARRKFLKTNPTEMGHITEQFARIALAHPGAACALRSQQRELHRLPPTGDRRQRIADFYGPELAEVLLPIAREGGGVRVEGYVAPPAQCRKANKWEYVFVNGRYVRDRFVSHAIKSAYRSLIQPDEHPVAFLFITIDPAQVDVNVHPTKVEVRWRDSNYVHAQVLAALRDKFLATNLDRPLRPPPPGDDEYRDRVRRAMVDFFTHGAPAQRGAAPPSATGSGAAGGAPPRPLRPMREPWLTEAAAVSTASAADRGAPLPAPSTGVPSDELEPPSSRPAPPATALAGAFPPPATTGAGAPPTAMQVHNAYLVAETDDGLAIIDQHALHERILYEELRRRITTRPLESQQLLIPEVVSVPPDRIEVLETHADTLARLGLSLSAVGPRSVALSAFPSLLERLDAPAFVRDLLDLLSQPGQQPNTEALVHRVLDMMACKAAVKAGDRLTPEEIAALLARRDLAERSSHCPHGRPTTLRLPLRDLERQFKRR